MQKSASAQDILAKVGNTPLVRLESLSDDTKEVHAKLEGHNPFGSVKDRAAYWMIREAEKEGLINRTRRTIIEPTSGNTGIALTGIARLLGYDAEIVIQKRPATRQSA